MNLQQAVQPRSSANGFSRRRVEKDNSGRMKNKLQPGKSNPSRAIVTSADVVNGSKVGGCENPSRDWLVYLTTCFIGYHVEVQVKNGSVFCGIFHATNADKDFGIVLKMARLTKDVSSRGQKAASDSVRRAPAKTLIIPSHEFVQLVAKDVSVTEDELSSELQGERQGDILLDSYISHSRHVKGERELERWVPDEEIPQRPELENVFDSPWTGGWDQFKVNEKLFGVKSTFNEELYTTKLERGPQTKELEEVALRIAREIEGEETHDLHLAEERGASALGDLDIDEETKYSSVYRGVDDSGYEEEDILLTSRDTDTFGDSAMPAFSRSFADVTGGKSGKSFEVGRVSSASSSKADETQPSHYKANRELYRSGSLPSDDSSSAGHSFEDDWRVQENHIDEQAGNAFVEETSNLEAQTAKLVDLQSSSDAKRGGPGVSSVAPKYSNVSTKADAKSTTGEPSEDKSGKVHAATETKRSRGRSGSSASLTPEGGAATSAPSAPALSPSSSVGSLSSEKSTLNPNAKEFKLNPNAKSFVPSHTSLRPISPVNEGSFYYPTAMPTVPHMHGVPVGMVGPSYVGPQPVLFNPQAAGVQPPQAYFPANGPQYGQQMILGHPRQVMYMPGYPAEMPYKGREY